MTKDEFCRRKDSTKRGKSVLYIKIDTTHTQFPKTYFIMIPLAQLKRHVAQMTIVISLLGALIVPTSAMASSPANCMAVTAGAVYAIGIAGVPEYGKPWMRSTTRLARLMQRVSDKSGYHTSPTSEAERLLLGSPALGRIAEFVLDPVGEVSQCIRKVQTPTVQEYGQASHGPKGKFASNLFLNISLSNPGGGLSVKYRF